MYNVIHPDLEISNRVLCEGGAQMITFGSSLKCKCLTLEVSYKNLYVYTNISIRIFYNRS